MKNEMRYGTVQAIGKGRVSGFTGKKVMAIQLVSLALF
jgi:hypothetical protein